MNLSHKVKTIMSTNFTSISEDTPVRKLKDMFKRRGIHHILVEDEVGALQGIISTEDLSRTAHFPVNEEQLLAKHIMTARPINVRPGTTIQEVIELFLDNYFRSIPVVNKKGLLTGIVTPYDIMTTLIQRSTL